MLTGVGRVVIADTGDGAAFVDLLQRAWDDGDAILPIDARLPSAAREAVLAAARADEPVDDGDALVVATSGTTGAPRCAVLTHDAVRASAAATSSHLAVDPSVDRWLACLPLAHVGGLGVVTRALLTGTPLTAHGGFDPDAVARAARVDGCTLVSLVPTALRRLPPDVATSFRVIVLGGSSMPDELPSNVVTTYGMTETAGGIVYDGRPLDGVEVRIVDGAIEVRAPMVLRCYRDGTDPKRADGWLPTGDAGELAQDRLVVHGRIGDVVVTGGEKVWPAAVERVLARHPSVAEVAVVGRPDTEWGARVVAVVVPRRGAVPPTLDALREHVRAELPAYAAPRELELVDELPRTTIGKVRRADL